MAWYSDWAYRKAITLSGATGAGTNYQVKLLVGESSGSTGCNFHVENHSADFPAARDDSGDLRFTDNDETTLLPFWVESVSGTTPNRIATVWVKVADSLESSADIYCYYDKVGASNVSSGTNTFILFNDGSTLTGMTAATIVGTMNWAVSGGKIRATSGVDWSGAGLYFDGQTGLNNYRVEAQIQAQDGLSGSFYEQGIKFDTTQSSADRGHARWRDDNKKWELFGASAGSSSAVDNTHDARVNSKFTFIKNDSAWDLRCDDSSKITRSESSFNAQYVGVFAYCRYSGHYVDYYDIRVSKYVSSEPAYSSAGGEESSSSSSSSRSSSSSSLSSSSSSLSSSSSSVSSSSCSSSSSSNSSSSSSNSSSSSSSSSLSSSSSSSSFSSSSSSSSSMSSSSSSSSSRSSSSSSSSSSRSSSSSSSSSCRSSSSSSCRSSSSSSSCGGWAYSFLGVSNVNIDKINGISRGNIAKVNGV